MGDPTDCTLAAVGDLRGDVTPAHRVIAVEEKEGVC